MNLTNLYGKLQEIEVSSSSEFVVSLDVAKLCSEFVTPAALSLLKENAFKKLASIISKMLAEQASQFKPE